MTWLSAAASEPTSLEGVLALRPDLLALYKGFYGRLWEDRIAPPGLLELARLRIAQLHDCAAELAIRHSTSGVTEEQIAALQDWRGATAYSPTECAALAIAEKFPWQYQEIGDDEAALLSGAIGEPAFVAFMIACALFDANCRLRLVFEVGPYTAGVPAPASTCGVLYKE